MWRDRPWHGSEYGPACSQLRGSGENIRRMLLGTSDGDNGKREMRKKEEKRERRQR